RRINASRPLNHSELRLHLPSSLRCRVTLDRHAEAAFAVDEPGHPSGRPQSFLLIVRTRHVVTIVNAASDVTMSSAGYSEFPAYSQMHTVLLPARGAAKLPD